MPPISERIKQVIEAENFSLLPETEFFNNIDPKATFENNRHCQFPSIILFLFYTECYGQTERGSVIY
jgi:hypothetical protein